jgi:hypothetical protein
MNAVRTSDAEEIVLSPTTRRRISCFGTSFARSRPPCRRSGASSHVDAIGRVTAPCKTGVLGGVAGGALELPEWPTPVQSMRELLLRGYRTWLGGPSISWIRMNHGAPSAGWCLYCENDVTVLRIGA